MFWVGFYETLELYIYIIAEVMSHQSKYIEFLMLTIKHRVL